MSAGAIGLIVLILLIIILFSGIQIGPGLMAVAFVGIMLSTGSFDVAASMLGSTAYTAIKTYAFAVVPLFVLLGMLANVAGASTELYDTASILLRKVRGGVGIATVIANAVFAAITGVSIASAAVFTKIALPEMHGQGYDTKFASGIIAGSSVLGMLIPPSTLMIVYGTLAEESIGKLFLGGVLPGIILTILYSLTISLKARRNPTLIGLDASGKSLNPNAAIDERKVSLKVILQPWGIVLLIIVTMGGIWGGFFTPTEAGGVGVAGALLLAIAKRKLTWANFKETLLDTGKTTGSVLLLLISAQMFSRMLAMTGVINVVSKAILSWGLPGLAILIIFCLIQVAMGCVLDSTSILLLTMPIMVPVMRQLGYDTVWYGILAIVVIEMGLITPPFGMSVFTVKSALSGTEFGEHYSVEDIFRGSAPFLIGMVILVVLMIAFPQIVTMLPNSMITM